MLLEIEECDLEVKLRDVREQIAMIKLKVCAEDDGKHVGCSVPRLGSWHSFSRFYSWRCRVMVLYSHNRVMLIYPHVSM